MSSFLNVLPFNVLPSQCPPLSKPSPLKVLPSESDPLIYDPTNRILLSMEQDPGIYHPMNRILSIIYGSYYLRRFLIIIITFHQCRKWATTGGSERT